ncbi:YfjI family protein [Desulfosporosinus sp. SB140]|uniref:YfjI family protein n=1 Tax=Desulfosporosinus paludis TaxID=3115649 RepID=UPI00388FB85B
MIETESMIPSGDVVSEILKFLQSIYGDTEGYTYIWLLKKKKTLWRSLTNLRDMAETAVRFGQSQDIYFPVCPQVKALSVNERGTLVSVHSMTCFYCDFDCQGGNHEQKNLPTFDEVWEWLESLPNPPSIIIFTGGGIHCYWLFDKPWIFESNDDRQKAQEMSRVWQQRFIRDFAKRGWKLDNTSDLTRVLRLPGTMNCKGDTPIPVQILSFEPERRYDIHQLVDMDSNSRDCRDNRDKVEHFIFDDCAFLRHCRDDAETLPEPEWYAAVSILSRLFKGVDLVHKISQPYPDYYRQETDRKILHAMNDAGPATCHRIKTEFPGYCEECRERIKSPVVLINPPKQSDDWGQIVPFNGEHELPEFPVEVFPGWLRDCVEAEAEALQVPMGLPGMIALSILATAVAGKAEIELRPGWHESLNLWVIAAMDPGNRKSKTFADLIHPLTLWESEKRKEFTPLVKQAESLKKLREGQISKLQTDAVKADNPDTAENLALRAAAIACEMEEMGTPSLPKLYLDDHTQEKLVIAMAEQGGRIAILSSEAGLFGLIEGRYVQSGGPNLDVYLKAFSGDPLRVDRIGRPSIQIDKPLLTIGVSVQPDALRGLLDVPHFRGRGLLGRFAYAIPKSFVGYRRLDTPSVPESVKVAYQAGMMRLLNLPLNDPPGLIQLSDDANQVFRDFEQTIETYLRPFGKLSGIIDWGAKLCGLTGRIAGILHLAENCFVSEPWALTMSGLTMQAATTLSMEYLILQALAAFEMMGANPRIEDAKYLLQAIEKKTYFTVSTLSKQDIWQWTRGRFKVASELDRALAILIERNYLRERIIEKGTVGRKYIEYELNPALGTESIAKIESTG